MADSLRLKLGALLGLSALLAGCAGETPVSPTGSGGGGSSGGGGGSCTVAVGLSASSISPLAGTAVIVRATVTKNGAAIPDGSSVQFTTDLGVFLENNLGAVSKTTTAGTADVTLGSNFAGDAHVKATFDCGQATLTISFQGVPSSGPFISSISPTSGSCAGGDTVTISGGRFGDGTAVTVFFGGAPAQLVRASSTTITVTTPARTLKDPSKPETVDVVVAVGGARSNTVSFTYFCVNPNQRTFISSMSPTAGTRAGGDVVQIFGGNFGNNIATTRVTFCGLPASITGLTDAQAGVTTPAYTLDNNTTASVACDVVLTKDLGLVSQQSATSPVPFTYRGTGGGGGGGGACNTDASFFISSITPNSGSPQGGTSVTITGGGFPTSASVLRVDFGGTQATILGTPTSSSITVLTPFHTLAHADVPETVDVTVTDLGSPNQRCARLSGAFIYTALALDPAIYSLSPRTGPNDQTTRVTIFGNNFQFPEQVFMTGGPCAAQRIEAQVVSIAPQQIVFLAPVAVGGNACLANVLVDVQVLNPVTGKTATCAACFKYYSCPAVANVSPSVADVLVTTPIVVTGNNFQPPVDINFRSPRGLASLNAFVTSVSNTSILINMPPLATLYGGAPQCSNLDGTLEFTFQGLTCTPTPLVTQFSYRGQPPTATTAAPNNLNQDGSIFGGPLGTPATISVQGANFVDPMTVTLIKDGAPVSNTPVNNANVANANTLTFFAPAVLDSSMNKQNCVPSGGASVTGTQFVATSFGIRLTSARTGCSVDLPNVLVYHP
ncbi:MAG TPA: IPT/TIG domain-containing protein, partial [Acidimicrobiia bacterium]|nr:IPT/TIG domain-containing protein [Acidimicrobiia bacterium]